MYGFTAKLSVPPSKVHLTIQIVVYIDIPYDQKSLKKYICLKLKFGSHKSTQNCPENKFVCLRIDLLVVNRLPYESLIDFSILLLSIAKNK